MAQNMLTVACVNVGNYLGMGDVYVERLKSMVSKHLTEPFEFVCITESDKAGWWAKIDLFKPGLFSGRVLYLDLDTVIVGNLDELVKHKGIVHLKDWGWTKNDYCSAIMIWDAGEHAEIYNNYDDDVPSLFRGDQDWITELGNWQALPVGMCVSYRYVSRKQPPKGACVVQFHGKPKPHEITTGWVPESWG